MGGDMRVFPTDTESLDINPCSRCKYEHSCSKSEYDADCWLRYVDKLRDNSVVITDSEWNDIVCSYIDSEDGLTASNPHVDKLFSQYLKELIRLKV